MKKNRIENPIRFDVDINKGLTDNQVKQRKEEGYANINPKSGGKSYLAIFIGNLCTFFNLLGIIIMILMLSIGSWGNMFFFVVILSNTVIGIIQEIKAKKSIEKLKLMSAPTSSIIRNGNKVELNVEEIVLDDIVVYDLGKQITSDSIVVEGEVETNESLLTGESVPVKKKVGDLLLSGSFVVSGKCKAKVEKVGIDNYVETLSSKAKQYRKPNSELINSINKIIKGIAIVIFPLGLLTFLVAIGNNPGEYKEAIEKASGSMIGMIPSGLVLLVSVTLTVSTIKLARKKTLVQDLYCIEMLARVNTLCLDKTGTITDGTMSLDNIVLYDKVPNYSVEELVSMLLNSTGDNNATAQALRKAFNLETKKEALNVIPFSSARKYSGASYEGIGTIVIGAPEFIIKNLNKEIKEKIEEYSKEGLRVLLLGHSNDILSEDDKLTNMTPVALFSIQDTIREDAVEIIDWFKNNDVHVKVISGDNPLSVSVIAKKVGIENADDYISLDGLSDEEVIEATNKYTVFGRVTPDQKALLIKTIRENGSTVAMTGDGVNDILAMKEADCAIAIASGSEATRNVAHLVLMDSRFSSMPSVVKEGRQVINNIQNSATLFLMKTIMTILVTITMLILKENYPFEPMHLYLIEFFIIGIPAFFLALRKNEALIKGSFLKSILAKTLPIGISLYLSVLGVYIFKGALGATQEQVTSMAMIAMSASGLLGLFYLCQPFKKVTTLVCLGSFISSIIGLIFFSTILGDSYIVPLDMNMRILVVCLVLLSFIIIEFTPVIIKLIKKKRGVTNA